MTQRVRCRGCIRLIVMQWLVSLRFFNNDHAPSRPGTRDPGTLRRKPIGQTHVWRKKLDRGALPTRILHRPIVLRCRPPRGQTSGRHLQRLNFGQKAQRIDLLVVSKSSSPPPIRCFWFVNPFLSVARRGGYRCVPLLCSFPAVQLRRREEKMALHNVPRRIIPHFWDLFLLPLRCSP